jgi:ADP-ribose pyrophosphatase YjhB (NUDIX family)
VGCSTRPGSHGFGNQPDQSAGAARYRRDPDTAPAAGRDLAASQTGTASSRPRTEPGRRQMRREYDHDPDAPAPTYVTPAAFVAVRDPAGALLLVRRRDTGDWELPGGRVEPGESATDAAVRETAEESGVNVEITGVVGICTDPGISSPSRVPGRCASRSRYVSTPGREAEPRAATRTRRATPGGSPPVTSRPCRSTRPSAGGSPTRWPRIAPVISTDVR